MSSKPAFKQMFHVEVVESDGVYLLSERDQVVLRGALYCQLAPLLDGRRTTDAVVDALVDRATPAEVYYALNLLEQGGYVADVDTTLPPARAAFWEALGLSAQEAEQRLRASTVALFTFGAVTADPFEAALAALDLKSGKDGELTVALTDDYLREDLAELNATALASGRPWLLIKPLGTQLWLGPLFRPGRTACWACLAERLRANRPVEAYLQHGRSVAAPFPVGHAALPASIATALQMAATEAARVLAGAEQSPLEGVLLTLDLLTMETRRHQVVRRPQCRQCGDPATPGVHGAAPLLLSRRPKPLIAAGSHRTAPPEQILATYERQISPITGVIPALERVPTDAPDDRLMHDYVAG